MRKYETKQLLDSSKAEQLIESDNDINENASDKQVEINSVEMQRDKNKDKEEPPQYERFVRSKDNDDDEYDNKDDETDVLDDILSEKKIDFLYELYLKSELECFRDCQEMGLSELLINCLIDLLKENNNNQHRICTLI